MIVAKLSNILTLIPIAATILCLTNNKNEYNFKAYRICDDKFVNFLTTSFDDVEV